MYAYIKYEKKCTRHGAKGIVSVHDIKHFNTKAINYAKLYNIQCGSNHCTGLVLMVDDTIALLEKKINYKRTTIPSRKMVESASDLTDEESSPKAASKQMTVIRQDVLREILKNKVESVKAQHAHSLGDQSYSNGNDCAPTGVTNYTAEKVNEDSLKKVQNNTCKNLKKKTDEVDTSKHVDCNERKTTKQATDKNIGKEVNTQQIATDKADTEGTTQYVDQNKHKLIKNKTIEDNTKKRVQQITQNSEKKNTAKESTKISTQDDIRRMDENKLQASALAKIKNNSMDKEIKTKSQKEPVEQQKRDKFEEGVQKCPQCQILASSEKELKKRLREALKQVDDLNKKVESLRANTDEEREISKQMQQLNIELQSEVIDFFKEIKSNTSEVMKQATIHVLQDENAVPVGHLRKRDQTVHLGQGVWLKESTYKAALMNVRSPAMFVKNMAVAVFGFEELANGSISGKASNNKRINKSKDNDSTAKPKSKLDPTKIMAIRDIYKQWLIQKGYNAFEIDEFVCKMPSVISHKINDMNRPAKVTLKVPSTGIVSARNRGEVSNDDEREDTDKINATSDEDTNSNERNDHEANKENSNHSDISYGDTFDKPGDSIASLNMSIDDSDTNMSVGCSDEAN